MNQHIALAMTASALALSGCYKTNYTTGNPAGGGPDQSIWEHRIINGMVEINPVDTGSICPGGIAKVHTEVSVLNGLAAYGLGLIGLPRIVYYPGTVQVWCKSGSAYNAEFSKEGELLSMTRTR